MTIDWGHLSVSGQKSSRVTKDIPQGLGGRGKGDVHGGRKALVRLSETTAIHSFIHSLTLQPTSQKRELANFKTDRNFPSPRRGNPVRERGTPPHHQFRAGTPCACAERAPTVATAIGPANPGGRTLTCAAVPPAASTSPRDTDSGLRGRRFKDPGARSPRPHSPLGSGPSSRAV